MSTFKGRMNEYQFLSIDRFDGVNLLSKMFFLSHCHEDHMTGLDGKQFINNLANGYRIYVSAVTELLLLHDPRYRILEPYLVALEINEPHLLTAGKGSTMDSITVTLLPAGHCPGSVMFLFEGAQGNVLYTGDIRLTLDDLKAMACLKTGDQIKPIKSVYFDSTFCTMETASIVPRCKSLDAIVELANNYLNARPSNRVMMYCSSKYGHEYLMCKISERLGMKMHVNGSKFELYKKIPDIGNYVTNDGASTRFHCCAFYVVEDEELSLVPKKNAGKNGLRFRQHVTPYSMPSCPDCRPYNGNVLVIKPSMLWFKQSRSISTVSHYDDRAHVYRVQYSCHSSLAEIEDLLKYLQPSFASPNVMPYASKDWSRVIAQFDDHFPTVAGYLRQSTDRSRHPSLTLAPDIIPQVGSRHNSVNGGTSSNFTCRKRFLELRGTNGKRKKRDESTKTDPKSAPAWLADWTCINVSDDSDGEPENAPDQNNAVPSDDDDDVQILSTVAASDSKPSHKCTAINCDQPIMNAEARVTDGPTSTTPANGHCSDTVEEEEDQFVLHLSLSSEEDEQAPADYDSDMDLFDPVPPRTNVDQDDDLKTAVEEPKQNVASPAEKKEQRDSLELIGVFKKNNDPPIITLSDDSIRESNDDLAMLIREKPKGRRRRKQNSESVRISYDPKLVAEDVKSFLSNANRPAQSKGRFIRQYSF